MCLASLPKWENETTAHISPDNWATWDHQQQHFRQWCVLFGAWYWNLFSSYDFCWYQQGLLKCEWVNSLHNFASMGIVRPLPTSHLTIGSSEIIGSTLVVMLYAILGCFFHPILPMGFSIVGALVKSWISPWFVQLCLDGTTETTALISLDKTTMQSEITTCITYNNIVYNFRAVFSYLVISVDRRRSQ